MDNLSIDVTSIGDAALELAIRLAMTGGKAAHVRYAKLKEQTRYFGMPTNDHMTRLVEDDQGVPTMIFLWHEDRHSQPLGRDINPFGAAQLATIWLKETEYGEEPDHDGSNRKGWRAFSHSIGDALGCHYTIIAIQPAWASYGK